MESFWKLSAVLNNTFCPSGDLVLAPKCDDLLLTSFTQLLLANVRSQPTSQMIPFFFFFNF